MTLGPAEFVVLLAGLAVVAGIVGLALYRPYQDSKKKLAIEGSNPDAAAEPSRQFSHLSSLFDDASARELMSLRRQFDDAELAAIREFDAAVGSDRIAIPIEAYRLQTAPRGTFDHLTIEQRHRAADAWPLRSKKIAEAEAQLRTRTVAVLKRFGYRDDHLPSVRRRKWVGPAVYGFHSVPISVGAEAWPMLQELRRLWTLSGRQPPG